MPSGLSNLELKFAKQQVVGLVHVLLVLLVVQSSARVARAHLPTFCEPISAWKSLDRPQTPPPKRDKQTPRWAMGEKDQCRPNKAQKTAGLNREFHVNMGTCDVQQDGARVVC